MMRTVLHDTNKHEDPLLTRFVCQGVLTKGTIIEVNVSELGMVTAGYINALLFNFYVADLC